MRFGFIIKLIHGSLGVSQRNKPRGGRQPLFLKIRRQLSGLLLGQRPVAYPRHFTFNDVPYLGPARKPPAGLRKFIISKWAPAARLRPQPDPPAKCSLIAQHRFADRKKAKGRG